MTTNQLDELLMHRLRQRGINADRAQARVLRLAERSLHRWHEAECGGSNAHGSFCIERDEKTGTPFYCYYPHDQSIPNRRHRIPDKEATAIARITTACTALGCHFFVQTDPRGCALYVSAEPLTPSNYSNGLACCV
jgi:hypothetical protein